MYVADIDEEAVLVEMHWRLVEAVDDVSLSDGEREQAVWDLDDVRARLAELRA